jgi:glycosyltransferase involved in cell wall biosynthesis
VRIAFFSTLEHVPWGGSEPLWHSSAVLALEQGHQVLIIVYGWEKEHAKITQLRSLGAVVRFRQRKKSGANILEKVYLYLKKNIRNWEPTLTVLARFHPEFICISQGGSFDIAYESNNDLRHMIQNLGCPYIVICQNNADVGFVPQKIVRDRMRNIFLQAKKVLFTSRRNHLVAERQMCTEFNNVFITCNPQTLKEFSIKPYPPDDVVRFAEVAALVCSHKGQDILLNVLSSEKWKKRTWILDLYGIGQDEDYIKELVKYYALEDRVTLKGYVEYLDEVWESHHLYLLPSLGEAKPISLFDASLCGRATVTTDVGSNEELVVDNVSGFLCAAPTVKLFDETLERAWQNKHRWKEMGEKAFYLAKSQLDPNPARTLLEILIR